MFSKKNYELIFFSLVFIYIFSISFNQFYNQHWTSILDQDPVIIYNALLVSSGIEQEYRDHPAYTTIMILGGIFKFLSLFFENFKIDKVMSSETIDDDFQILFYIARVLNSLYVFLTAIFFFKVLKQLKIKKEICILSILIFIFFLATYELLYLIRSEIVSILFSVISLYYFLKSINENKIFYTILSGFFLCFAMLAKIQIVFFIFIFLISIPNLLKYLENKDVSLNLENYNYRLAFWLVIIFVLFFIFYQTFIGVIFLNQTQNETFFLTNNLDFYAFIIFIIFFRIYGYYLNKKKIIKNDILIKIISLIIVGFISCIIFIFLLDFLKVIPIHKSIFLRVLNPLEFMNTYTIKSKTELVNIFVSIKEFFLIGLNDLSYDFNEFYEHKILGIKSRIFFRLIYLILSLSLIFISVFFIKNKETQSLSLKLLIGMFVYFFIFNIRETHGYNIYIILFFLILVAITNNNFSTKISRGFYLILFLVIVLENLSFSNIHKNAYKREPRVYDICKSYKLDKWKNSNDYFSNYIFSSPIKLVEGYQIGTWFADLLNILHVNGKFFFFRYCDQVEDFSSKKVNFYFKTRD